MCLGEEARYLLLLLVTVGYVYCGPTCLSCTAAPLSRDCLRVTQCGQHEHCYTDLIAMSDGSVHIEHGCRDVNLCGSIGKRHYHINLTVSTRSGGLKICSQCCQGNICNNNLCGQKGFATNLGPVCYGCDQQLTTDSCTSIVQCGRDERVIAQSTNDVLYTSKCTEKIACDSQVTIYSNAFGRRRHLNYFEDPHGECLIKCCDSNVCNRGPCSSNVFVAPTRQPTTQAPTQPTTQAPTQPTTQAPTQPTTQAPTHPPRAHDCSDILHMGIGRTSGVYTVTTWKTNRRVQVYCDQTTQGGGWTVFQRRIDGSVDFYRDFATYEAGFGHINGEFWLGLSFIQEIVSRNTYNSLRIDVQAPNSTWYYDVYDGFSLSPGPAYAINVGRRIDSLGMIIGNTLRSDPHHDINGRSFSAFDKDQDLATFNCASSFHGAWWYNQCYSANLNGKYLATPGTSSEGMVYMPFSDINKYDTAKGSKIMLRKA